MLARYGPRALAEKHRSATSLMRVLDLAGGIIGDGHSSGVVRGDNDRLSPLAVAEGRNDANAARRSRREAWVPEGEAGSRRASGVRTSPW